MTATCNTCQFKHTIPWKQEDGTEGENVFCRRYPPTMLPSGQQSALAPVRLDGWCGEYLAAPVKRRAKS